MPEILIVADDYTGANDTAVLMARMGFHACTVLGTEDDPGPDAGRRAVPERMSCPRGSTG